MTATASPHASGRYWNQMEDLQQDITDSMYRSICICRRRERNKFHSKHVAHIIWCKYELAKIMMRNCK